MRASSPICLALTHSARQGRATPFKEKRSSLEDEKRRSQKKPSGSRIIFIYHEFENYNFDFLGLGYWVDTINGGVNPRLCSFAPSGLLFIPIQII